MCSITLNCAFALDSILIHLLTLKCHHAENAVSGSRLPGRSWLCLLAPCHPAAVHPQDTSLQHSEWNAASPFWRDLPSNARYELSPYTPQQCVAGQGSVQDTRERSMSLLTGQGPEAAFLPLQGTLKLFTAQIVR